jgi:hypothetical protein
MYVLFALARALIANKIDGRRPSGFDFKSKIAGLA